MATDTKGQAVGTYVFRKAMVSPQVGLYVWPKTGMMPPENITDPMVVKAVHDDYIEVGFHTDNETCSTFKIDSRQPMWVSIGRVI